MHTVRDRLWLWGHVAGCHNPWVKRDCRATPAEGARRLGLDNLMMVVFGNQPEPAAFPAHQATFAGLRRVVWSVMGDSSSTRNDQRDDVEAVLALAQGHPNIVGGIMDDLFLAPEQVVPGGPVARWDAARIAAVRQRLHAATPRPLELEAVFYDLLLARAARDPAYRQRLWAHVAACDVLTYWTWRADALSDLERSFAQVQEMTTACGVRALLGIYLFDYGASREMPLPALQRQCELGLQWLQAGRIDGLIFLASAIADADLPAVAWARDWIARVGDTPLHAG